MVSYSSEESTVSSTLVAVSIFRTAAELSERVLDTCAGLVYTTMRKASIDSTYAVWVGLYAFCEFAMYWLLETSNVSIGFVLHCIDFSQDYSGFVVLTLDTSGAA